MFIEIKTLFIINKSVANIFKVIVQYLVNFFNSSKLERNQHIKANLSSQLEKCHYVNKEKVKALESNPVEHHTIFFHSQKVDFL